VTSLEVRACTPDDQAAVQRLDEIAFGYTGDPEEDGPEVDLLELDRSLLAYAGPVPVGHTTSYSLRMSIPGGEASVAGVTWVSVLPTYRRQGVLTALMRRQLADVYAAGEPLAALYASEPAIYGRFGFGLASQRYELSIDRAYAATSGPVDPALRLRVTTPEEARPDVERVYDQVRKLRAGMPARGEKWWRRIVNDPKGRRDGASELRAFVVSDDAGPRAYALYNTKDDWSTGSANGVLHVLEHGALDVAAAHALWRLITSIDLIVTVKHWNVAVDDVVLQLLDNLRRARPTLRDSEYVRLVDLPAALIARTYDVPYDGVVEVTDEFAPWNAGRWRVSLHADGSTCVRSSDEPDLVLDVRCLGGAYLGSGSLVALAAAGQVCERTPGAVAALTRAMRREPAAYCPFVF
jgi:predicted acetyltransferase